MRKILFALIALIGIGAAGYFALPFTPIPAYFKDVTHRISLLFGEAPKAPVTLPKRLQAKLDKVGLSKGAPVALQIMTESGAVALWLRDGDRFRPLDIFPFCSDAIRDGDLVDYLGDYSITKGDIILNRDDHASLMLRRAKADDAAPATDTDTATDTSSSTAPAKPSASELALNGGCSPKNGIPLESDDLRDIMLMVDAAIEAGHSPVAVSIYPTAAEQPTPHFSDGATHTDTKD